jgi:outer membrane lipoprotein-sorting protein
MKNSIIVTTLGFFLLSSLPCFGEEDAQRILEAANVLIRGDKSAFYHFTMTMKKAEWSKASTLDMYLKGTEKAFGYFLSPAQEEGTAYLRIEHKIWMYVPYLEEIVKITPSMMHLGIMGSNFSYGDLIIVNGISEVYIPRISAEEVIDGAEMYILQLLPKREFRVTYGKLKMWVAKKGNIPFKIEYHTEKDELVRILYYKKNEKVGGRIIPVVWEMGGGEDPSIRTILSVSDAKFNIPMDDDIFTKKNLTTGSKLPLTSSVASPDENQ